jgi:ribosomal protein L11 methylase PrmA
MRHRGTACVHVKIMPRQKKRNADRLAQTQERMGAKNLEDVRRTRRYVEREGLCSVMNDTKWERLVAAIQSLRGFTPQYRQKHARASEPADWDGEWHYHLRPFSVIEWIDIDPLDRRQYPATDRTDEIEKLLRAIPVPFSREGSALRVWGYLRAGVPPRWA